MSRHSMLVLFVIIQLMQSTLASSVVVVVLDEKHVLENRNIQTILTKSGNVSDVNNSSSDVKFIPFLPQSVEDIVPKLCQYVQNGIVAVLDTSTDMSVGQMVRSFCDDAGIAYITALDPFYLDLQMTGMTNGTVIRLEVPSAIMLRVVASIARSQNLNNIAIVYDDTFDIEHTPRRLLTNVPAQHMYIKIHDSKSKLEESIEHLMKINMQILFLIASRSKAQAFISKMLDLKKENFDPNIFVLTKDYTLTCDKCERTDPLLLITANTEQDPRASFIDFMQEANIEPRFQPERIKVDEGLIYDLVILIRNAIGGMSNVIPISYPQECPDNMTPVNKESYVQQSQALIGMLSKTSVMGVFGPLSYDTEERVIKYNMTLRIENRTYNAGHINSAVLLATWTEENNIHMKDNITTLISTDKRKTYRIVTVSDSPPFVYKKQGTNNSSKPSDYYGYCIDLLNKISESLKFDYVIYDVDTIGTMNDEGKWSGMMKELIENRADIAVGPISVMAEREKVIDFTVPYYDLVGLTILMRKPRFDYSLVKFLSVLDEKVWACIVGAFALFSILISLFDRLSPFSYQNQKSKWNRDGAEPRIFTLKEGVWFCMMSLTPQGGGETPRALSGRLVAATWWLFGFIIIATYTANLAAFLTVSRLEQPIQSLDDLSKQFKVQYAPQEGSIAHVYFERMKYIEDRFYDIWKNMSLDDKLGDVERAKLAVWDYPVSDKYTKLLDTMKKTGYPKTLNEAMSRVLDGNFAFIADSTTNKYQEKTNCFVWEVGEEFSRKPYALAVQEGSQLRSDLSNVILQLINQRSLEEMKTDWWTKYQKECPKLEDESDGISIRNIGGVFLVIVIGSGFSLIALVFECYWYRLRPGAKPLSSKPKTQGSQQVKRPNSSSIKAREAEDHNTNKKNGLDSNFVSILDASYTNNAFEIVERL